jgi:hypothetical protein
MWDFLFKGYFGPFKCNQHFSLLYFSSLSVLLNNLSNLLYFSLISLFLYSLSPISLLSLSLHNQTYHNINYPASSQILINKIKPVSCTNHDSIQLHFMCSRADMPFIDIWSRLRVRLVWGREKRRKENCGNQCMNLD